MTSIDDRDAGADPQPAWVEVGRWGSATRADEHALVLQAVGVGSTIVELSDPAGYSLVVAASDAVRARDELTRFARENRGWPPRPVSLPPVTPGVGAALVYAALLAIAFLAQRQESWGVDWMTAGRADAALIRAGEWRRAITALTLHADVVHLSGNILFGAVFGVILAQGVGAGAAWLAFLIAGGAGNFINAWWQPPSHLAIGASTGVFGLLGAVAACDWMRRGRLRRHALRRWSPIIMGVALLLWFGMSREPNVDIAAHIFGFGAGLPIGALLAVAPASWSRERAQQILTVITIAVMAIAWATAVIRRA